MKSKSPVIPGWVTDDAPAEELGLQLVAMLNLRPVKGDDGKRYQPDRYMTSWGNKTAVGLTRCVLGVVETFVQQHQPVSPHKP